MTNRAKPRARKSSLKGISSLRGSEIAVSAGSFRLLKMYSTKSFWFGLTS
jgi:hypothetical protein